MTPSSPTRTASSRTILPYSPKTPTGNTKTACSPAFAPRTWPFARRYDAADLSFGRQCLVLRRHRPRAVTTNQRCRRPDGGAPGLATGEDARQHHGSSGDSSDHFRPPATPWWRGRPRRCMIRGPAYTRRPAVDGRLRRCRRASTRSSWKLRRRARRCASSRKSSSCPSSRSRLPVQGNHIHLLVEACELLFDEERALFSACASVSIARRRMRSRLRWDGKGARRRASPRRRAARCARRQRSARATRPRVHAQS